MFVRTVMEVQTKADVRKLMRELQDRMVVDFFDTLLVDKSKWKREVIHDDRLTRYRLYDAKDGILMYDFVWDEEDDLHSVMEDYAEVLTENWEE